MAWDPTHPATGTGVVSAPLRDNFAALNTQLMAPLIAAPVEQVLKVGASDTLAGITTGTNGQVLTLVAGAPSWSTPAFVSPMTAVGDLIRGTTAGAPQRLAIGTTGQVLTAVGGVPAWAALPVDPGFANPMVGVGDLITGATAGAAQRLAAVATGAVLASAGVGTVPTWNTAPMLTGLTLSGLTPGSVIFAGASGVLSQDAGLTYDISGKHLTVAGFGSEIAMVPATTASLIQISGTGAYTVQLRTAGTGDFSGNGTFGFYNVSLADWYLYWPVSGQCYMKVANVAARLVTTGALNSGGSGFRTLIIAN